MALANMEQTCEFSTLSHILTKYYQPCVQNIKQNINCSRFHIWDEELKQCLQINSTTIEVTSSHEEQDSTSKNKYLQDEQR